MQKASYLGSWLSVKLLAWIWLAIIFASSLAVGWAALSHSTAPVRPLLAFWFFLVIPGMALVRLLHLENSVAEWSLAIALSLAVDAIVAGTMAYLRIGTVNLGLLVLVAISLVGAVLQVAAAYGWLSAAFGGIL